MKTGDVETMKIEQSVIDEIKTGSRLSAYIASKGIRLKKVGKGLAGKCPFHNDTKESLLINDQKGLWNCLGACSAGGNGGSGGDIISFVMKYESCSFPEAVGKLRPDLIKTDATVPKRSGILARVIEIYHQSFLESRTAQEYISSRGIDPQLAKQYRAGYVDGSLLEKVLRESSDWKILQDIGIITDAGNELMRTCVTFPLTAFNQAPVGLYGRATGKDLHLYLPGPRRGLFNWNTARNHPEIILTESIIDALSFIQCGYLNAIPIYGTNGFIQEHTEFLQRFGVKKVILALDPDESGKKAAAAIAGKLQLIGIVTQSLQLPAGVDPNALLQKEGVERFKKIIEEQLKEKTSITAPQQPAAAQLYQEMSEGELLATIEDRTYNIRGVPKKSYNRLRVALMLAVKESTYLDAVDLYMHRSRNAYAAAAAAHFDLQKLTIEQDLCLILDAVQQYQKRPAETAKLETTMTEEEKKEALAFLKSPRLLEAAVKDMEALGYVGEEANKKLGYLASISRFLDDPLSIVILSQSGSGKSYLAEVLEKLTAPESVRCTRVSLLRRFIILAKTRSLTSSSSSKSAPARPKRITRSDRFSRGKSFLF